MPGANDVRDLLKEDRTAQLDQDDDDGGGHRHRCYGVQHNAKRAMVGIRAVGVDVRDLAECKQEEQQQTQHRNRDAKDARPGGPVPV